MHLPHLHQTCDGKPEKLWWDQNYCISRGDGEALSAHMNVFWNASTTAGGKREILTKLGLQFFFFIPFNRLFSSIKCQQNPKLKNGTKTKSVLICVKELNSVWVIIWMIVCQCVLCVLGRACVPLHASWLSAPPSAQNVMDLIGKASWQPCLISLQ